MDATPVLILVGLALWSAGYAAILNRVHDLYVPDYTWLTVVLGNLWILLGYAALNVAGYSGWAWVLACNVAAGVPIIGWQLIQAYQRHLRALTRKSRNGNGNGANPPHEGGASES